MEGGLHPLLADVAHARAHTHLLGMLVERIFNPSTWQTGGKHQQREKKSRKGANDEKRRLLGNWEVQGCHRRPQCTGADLKGWGLDHSVQNPGSWPVAQ